MNKTNKRFLLIVIFLTEICNQSQCSTVVCRPRLNCIEGQYCNADVCHPCHDGYYQQFRSHIETLCKKKTEKTGNGWRLIHPGNSSTDNQWGCDTDYYEYNNSGIIECREDVRQITTESGLTTTDSEKNNGTSITPTSSENNYKIVAIIGGIIGSIVLIAISWLLYRRREKLPCILLNQQHGNRKQSKLRCDAENPMIPPPNNTSNVHNQKLNSDENKILDNSFKSDSDTIQSNDLIMSGENKNTNNELPMISTNIPTIGQELIQNNSGASSDDTELDESYLEGKKKVNEAFKRMSYELIKKLGNRGPEVLTLLNIESSDTNRPIVINFTDCLSTWSENFSMHELKNGLWLPLRKLEKVLVCIERNDIVEKFEDLTKEVMKHINKLNNIL